MAQTYWREDVRRYPKHSLFLQPGLWAIGVYRFGRWARTLPAALRPVGTALYFAAYTWVRLATGIDIPRSVTIGPGLMIHHFGGITLNPAVVMGSGCTLRHGVTIGNRETNDAPVLENDIELGAYAQILGPVRIGSRAKIGAMSLVLTDVPADSVAVGIPARVLQRKDAAEGR